MMTTMMHHTEEWIMTMVGLVAILFGIAEVYGLGPLSVLTMVIYFPCTLLTVATSIFSHATTYSVLFNFLSFGTLFWSRDSVRIQNLVDLILQTHDVLQLCYVWSIIMVYHLGCAVSCSLRELIICLLAFKGMVPRFKADYDKSQEQEAYCELLRTRDREHKEKVFRIGTALMMARNKVCGSCNDTKIENSNLQEEIATQKLMLAKAQEEKEVLISDLEYALDINRANSPVCSHEGYFSEEYLNNAVAEAKEMTKKEYAEHIFSQKDLEKAVCDAEKSVLEKCTAIMEEKDASIKALGTQCQELVEKASGFEADVTKQYNEKMENIKVAEVEFANLNDKLGEKEEEISGLNDLVTTKEAENNTLMEQVKVKNAELELKDQEIAHWKSLYNDFKDQDVKMGDTFLSPRASDGLSSRLSMPLPTTVHKLTSAAPLSASTSLLSFLQAGNASARWIPQLHSLSLNHGIHGFGAPSIRRTCSAVACRKCYPDMAPPLLKRILDIKVLPTESDPENIPMPLVPVIRITPPSESVVSNTTAATNDAGMQASDQVSTAASSAPSPLSCGLLSLLKTLQIPRPATSLIQQVALQTALSTAQTKPQTTVEPESQPPNTDAGATTTGFKNPTTAPQTSTAIDLAGTPVEKPPALFDQKFAPANQTSHTTNQPSTPAEETSTVITQDSTTTSDQLSSTTKNTPAESTSQPSKIAAVKNSIVGASVEKASEIILGWTHDLLVMIDHWTPETPAFEEEADVRKVYRYIAGWMIQASNGKVVVKTDQILRETSVLLFTEKYAKYLRGQQNTEPPKDMESVAGKRWESMTLQLQLANKILALEADRVKRGSELYDMHRRLVVVNGRKKMHESNWSDVCIESNKMIKGSLRPTLEAWISDGATVGQVKSVKTTLGHIALWLLNEDVSQGDKEAFLFAGRDLATFVDNLARYIAIFPRASKDKNTAVELALFGLDDEVEVIKEADSGREKRANIGGFAPQSM